MSGDILIVDSVATNRIVLKVKLSAAFYSVLQASSAQDALAMCQLTPPDLILVAADPADMGFAQFVQKLNTLPHCSTMSVVALIASDNPALRLQLLKSGAEDVIATPIADAVLLARLRSLLRNAHTEADFRLQPITAEALGFAEAAAPFVQRGQVAAVAPCKSKSHAARIANLHRCTFFRTLAAQSAHRIERYDLCSGNGFRNLSYQPDAVVLEIGPSADDPGYALLADLQTAPQTRQSRIVALLHRAQAPQAATVLDMGAHDVVGFDTHPSEVEWRLNLQIERKLQHDQLRARLKTGLQAALTDPLTGLYNRRFAMTQMARLIEDATAQQNHFAVILADLDHFKQVNDRHGHAAGDAVLTQVAQLMRAALRGEDTVARIGGEEFLILLPDTTPQMARLTAGRLCRSIRETPLFVVGIGEPIHVTISLGVTLTDEVDPSDRLDAEALYTQADRALYGSKSGGRDTVTFSAKSAA